MEPKKEDFPLRQENLHLSLLENDNYLQAVLTIITIFQLLLAKRLEVSFGNLGKFRYSIFFLNPVPPTKYQQTVPHTSGLVQEMHKNKASP
jgi:hypothetical protein